MVTEDCFKWASQRMVFGKPLIEQAVIRSKWALIPFLGHKSYSSVITLILYVLKARSDDLSSRNSASMAR